MYSVRHCFQPVDKQVGYASDRINALDAAAIFQLFDSQYDARRFVALAIRPGRVNELDA